MKLRIFMSLIFSLFFASLQAMEAAAAAMAVNTVSEHAVRFTDFVNQDSPFWQLFAQKSCAEKILALFRFGKLDHEIPADCTAAWLFPTSKYEQHAVLKLAKIGIKAKNIVSTITITDVPAYDTGSTTLTLLLYLRDAGIGIALDDAHDNTCFFGKVKANGKSAELAVLSIVPTVGSICFVGEMRRLISGNTAMNIWDSFCAGCGFEDVKISDESVFDIYDLRILLPYIYGRSWYMKFGYVPLTCPIAQYKKIVSILAQRPCTTILHDFADNNSITVQLLLCLGKTGVPLNAPLGLLVQKLYQGMRAGSLVCKQLLSFVYKQLLCDYPCTNDDVCDQITYLQKILQRSGYYKQYC